MKISLELILSLWKNFVGTQKRVRINHGRRAIRARAIEIFYCMYPQHIFSWGSKKNYRTFYMKKIALSEPISPLMWSTVSNNSCMWKAKVSTNVQIAMYAYEQTHILFCPGLSTASSNKTKLSRMQYNRL